MQVCDLGRAPAALAGDDLVFVRLALGRPHDERLHKAALANGVRELLEMALIEIAAGIEPARAQGRERHGALVVRIRAGIVGADQRRQAPA